MNKLSKRLQSLASFVDKEDILVDVGCDHGYLSIYLVKNELCKKAICSDINKNALQSAIENIKKNNVDIATYLSDGIKNVPLDDVNALIISGMGTGTIIDILKDNNKIKKIEKIILQSNNNHEMLRRYMNSIGYYMLKETATFDKNKWYVSMLFIKDAKKNNEKELKYGYLNNEEYKKYLLNNTKKILAKIPKSSPDYLKQMEFLKDID